MLAQTTDKIENLHSYINMYKQLKELQDSMLEKEGKQINVALLSSFTVNGIKETLFVKCIKEGILPGFYQCGYNQYIQDITNLQSDLYHFRPDIVIFFIDIMATMGDLYFDPYRIGDEDRKNIMEEKLDEILLLIEMLKERTSAKVIVHNFMIPIYSPLGILENKQQFGFLGSVRYINDRLAEAFKDDNRVLVFDFDTFCSSVGKRDLIDYKMYYIGDIKLRFEHVPTLCDKYLGYIRPMLSLTRKCIVLDLDNTLWGGVVGEDGIEGIKLGPTPEGRPFMEFQKYLLSLYNRGLILAINSKNNLEDALKIIREHPYMVLREEHFAAMQINWNDKVTNMKAIASELNVGTDSLVFIDDDRLNREMISTEMPEVRVVDLPADSSLYVKTLIELEDFNILQLTEEDRVKGKMYAEQRMRNELLCSSINTTEYLERLQMVVTIEEANSMNIPRIAQLTQKTNQFNMTTRRYQEDDILSKVKQGYLVAAIKVEDKFGDNGITGVVIVERGKQWRIDSLLLSCRIIGRKVEDTLLAYVVNCARKYHVDMIIGEFIPTKKNVPAKNFYRDSGFVLASTEDGREIWNLSTERGYEAPSFVRVIER